MDKYWTIRADKKLAFGDKSAEQSLKIMSQTYRDSFMNIKKEIEAFYGRYAKNNNLTFEEVHKRLNPEELKSWKEETRKYYEYIDKFARNHKGKVDVNLLRKHKEEIRLQSAKSYMSRLEELKTALKREVIKLGLNENVEFTDRLGNLYSDTYMRTNFDIDKYIGMSSGFERLNTQKIETALKEKWLGENYSDRIWDNKERLLNQLDTTFMQGIAQGWNSRKVADEMAKKYGTSYYNCERLCRTEMGHIMGEATAESYRQHGIDQYQFVCGFDERTCPTCGALDGQIFDTKYREEGINYPEMHPNCRCTTIPYFEPDEIDEMFEESDRLSKQDDEYFEVPVSMTYSEWIEMIKK